VTIINKSNATKYSTLAHRDIRPGGQSADVDAAGFKLALRTVVSACGNSFYVRLNPEERLLLDHLNRLAEAGREFKFTGVQPPTAKEMVLKRDAEAKARKVAAIEAGQRKEESIRSETTYASRRDIDEAAARSQSMKGDVAAKKLEEGKSELSLQDLMGDNRFIEESMKHSNIATAMASEEGWDMEKMNAPKVKDVEGKTSAPAAAEKTDTADATEKPKRRAGKGGKAGKRVTNDEKSEKSE